MKTHHILTLAAVGATLLGAWSGAADAPKIVITKANFQINRVHKGYVSQFERASGFGVGRMGPSFRPSIPEFGPGSISPLAIFDGTTYDLTSLQLVSTLENDPPVAYIVDGVPAKKKLKEIKTRPLSNPEMKALRKLEKGDDSVFYKDGDDIRFLGSIRARAYCIKCHKDKKENDLLGAFTYMLRESEIELDLPESEQDGAHQRGSAAGASAPRR